MRFFFLQEQHLLVTCVVIYVVIVEKTKNKKKIFIFNSEGSPWKFSCSFFIIINIIIFQFDISLKNT
jgi:hypothetical protein